MQELLGFDLLMKGVRFDLIDGRDDFVVKDKVQ